MQVDLRSDKLTKPSETMWKAMAAVPLLVASRTMANQLAIDLGHSTVTDEGIQHAFAAFGRLSG